MINLRDIDIVKIDNSDQIVLLGMLKKIIEWLKYRNLWELCKKDIAGTPI